jgi:hypothetical protein
MKVVIDERKREEERDIRVEERAKTADRTRKRDTGQGARGICKEKD